MSTRPPAHNVKPSAGGRIFFGILGFFIVPALMLWAGIQRAAHWVWKAPWFVKGVLGLLVLGVLVGVAYVYRSRTGDRAQESITAEWRKFETASKAADEKELLAILDAILVKDPANKEAQSRKSAITTGETDPGDRPMVALSIRIHLKNNRQSDAVREATKMYALDPKDWISNCILGQDAITRKDEPAIEKYLSAVGDVQTAIPPDLGGLLYALELYRQTGKDATILRTYTVNKVIPNLKNANLGTILPAGRVQILACYIDTCLSVPDASVQNVREYWAWASQLADGILDDAKTGRSAQILNQLGTLQPPLAGAIARFQKLNLWTEQEAKRQAKQVEDRAREIWKAAREIDPKNSVGYVGEAHALIRAGDLPAARAMIDAGLDALGMWDIRLLSAYTAWAKAAGKTDDVWPKLLDAAKRYPENVALWQLVVEATEASNRRDVAIDAIKKARSQAPDNSWFAWNEARLWLDAGYAGRALEMLKSIPETDRLKHPTIIRAYVRALVEAGEESAVPAFSRAAMDSGQKANEAEFSLAPALGLLDCPPSVERAKQAVEIAEQVAGRWLTSFEAHRVRAKARIVLAEEDVGENGKRWSEVNVQAAIDALERLKTRNLTDPWVPAMLAWVRIKGGQSADLAWKEIEPVVAAEADPALPADVLESFGVVYYARGQYVEAIRVLKRAEEIARKPAGAQVALALALYKNGDVVEAKRALQRAKNQSRSPRVNEEFQEAAKIIR